MLTESHTKGEREKIGKRFSTSWERSFIKINRKGEEKTGHFVVFITKYKKLTQLRKKTKTFSSLILQISRNEQNSYWEKTVKKLELVKSEREKKINVLARITHWQIYLTEENCGRSQAMIIYQKKTINGRTFNENFKSVKIKKTEAPFTPLHPMYLHKKPGIESSQVFV